MKIVFEQKKINKGTIKVSLDGGVTYTNYEIEDVVETGIPLDDSQDLSKIKIKGSTNILQSAEVVSSVKVNDAEGVKFILDTDNYGSNFPACVVGVIIQDGITSISKKAGFSGYTNLKSVDISNTVTSINDYAFSGCMFLKNVNIPDSVTFVGMHAFESTGLTSINIPSSIKVIDSYDFCGCSKLTSVVIPHGITIIGICAFRDCSKLTTVSISDSVTAINYNAFLNCSSLTTINYTGTQEQWEAITKGTDWNKGCPEDMQIVYNYQG